MVCSGLTTPVLCPAGGEPGALLGGLRGSPPNTLLLGSSLARTLRPLMPVSGLCPSTADWWVRPRTSPCLSVPPPWESRSALGVGGWGLRTNSAPAWGRAGAGVRSPSAHVCLSGSRLVPFGAS